MTSEEELINAYLLTLSELSLRSSSLDLLELSASFLV
ncbi:unnamed protein product [Rhodiola kirilowii]